MPSRHSYHHAVMNAHLLPQQRARRLVIEQYLLWYTRCFTQSSRTHQHWAVRAFGAAEVPWDEGTCYYFSFRNTIPKCYTCTDLVTERTSQNCALPHLHATHSSRKHNQWAVQTFGAAAMPWDEDTCYFAALHGHLTVLIFAREHGCKWDSGKSCTHTYILLLYFLVYV
jgi:hypothetical protein